MRRTHATDPTSMLGTSCCQVHMDSSERVCHVDPLAAWATPSAACHCYDLLRLGMTWASFCLVSAWFLRVAC